MTPAGTAAGSAGLAALQADPGRAVVALDYDGTLAPVVDRPQDAVPAPGAVDALTALAPQVGVLALITGRPADVVVELGGLACVPGLVVLGQYGAQRWHDGALSGAAELPGVAGARGELPALLEVEGAWLEDKGLSLVVHTRTAADPAGAQARLDGPITQVGRAHGLEVHRGRLVLELRPPGFDKGAALASLCESAPSAVLFAGDDLGDLAAFDELDRQRSRGVPGLAVCSASAEGPQVLRERADLVVDGPAGVVEVLAGLLGR